jgi:hypothetical protein
MFQLTGRGRKKEFSKVIFTIIHVKQNETKIRERLRKIGAKQQNNK